MQCKSLTFVFIFYISSFCAFGRIPGDISRTKCREYAKYAKTSDAEAQTKECGHTIVKRVVGGELAGRNEFSHMVALGFQSFEEIAWVCGGVLISDQFVLTAAVCLEAPGYGAPKYAKLGVTNLNDNSTHKQQILISETIPNPQFKKSSLYHDIGLVKLEKPVELNSFARPACLYPNREIRAKKAIVTGWGATSFGGPPSDELLKVSLDLVDFSTCNNTYKNQISRKLKQGIIDDVQFCAGSERDQKDSCQGDNGGPLQVYHTGDDIACMYDIIGVTSFGKACGAAPGVYTRVSNYIKWIEDVVWP